MSELLPIDTGLVDYLGRPILKTPCPPQKKESSLADYLLLKLKLKLAYQSRDINGIAYCLSELKRRASR